MKFEQAVAAVLLLALAGCGLPPAVVVAQYAADGVSYAVSGKSVTDHTISIAVDQDCALLRVVQGSEMCFEEDADSNETIMMAAAGEAPFEGNASLAADPMASLVSLTPVDDAAGPVVTVNGGPEPHARGLAAIGADEATAPRIATVIGSFQARQHAARHRAAYAALGTEVVSVLVDGVRWYRVVTTAPLADVVDAGVADAWRINLCAEPARNPQCIEPLSAA